MLIEITSCKLNRLKVNYTVIIWFLVHYIQINMVPVWLDDHFNYMYCDTSTSGQVKDYFHVYGVPYLVVYINLMPWACFVMIFMNFQFFSIKLEFCKSSRLIVWNWNFFPSHTHTTDWETQNPLKMVMNSGAPKGCATLSSYSFKKCSEEWDNTWKSLPLRYKYGTAHGEMLIYTSLVKG